MSFRIIGDTKDMSALINGVNQNIYGLKEREITEIFKDDAGMRRVLLGKGKNDFYGLKVSQAGKDVYNAANSELIFNSDQNIFKIVLKDSVQFTVGTGTTTTVTVPHNLGFAPQIVAFLNQVDVSVVGDDVNAPLPTWMDVSIDVPNNVIKFRGWLSCYVDAVNAYFLVLNSTGASFGTFPITYYLLQETVTDV